MLSRKSLYSPKPLAYLFRHYQASRIGFGQLSLSPLASFMTFIVIGIALALPMGLWILIQNMANVTQHLNTSTQITLYLEKNISADQLTELTNLIKNDASITQYSYISPEDGLKDFQKNIGINSPLLQFNTNPLPGIFILQPSTDIQDPLKLNQLLDRLNHLPYVTDTQLDMIWLQRFQGIIQLLHRLLFAIGLIFCLGVIFIIGNTIRLIIENHKDEIFVIKLIGGSDRFIRRPFLYSGILYGITGSIIAWFLIDLTLWWLKNPILHLASLYNTSFQIKGLNLSSTFFLIMSGALLGYIGSWLAVRKQIQSTEPK